MRIDKRQIRKMVSECVIGKILTEDDLAFPDALEPELIDLYNRFRETTDDGEKRELIQRICAIIDNRGKY